MNPAEDLPIMPIRPESDTPMPEGPTLQTKEMAFILIAVALLILVNLLGGYREMAMKRFNEARGANGQPYGRAGSLSGGTAVDGLDEEGYSTDSAERIKYEA